MLGNYLQQTTSADDIFRCIFFGALRVNFKDLCRENTCLWADLLVLVGDVIFFSHVVSWVRCGT